MDEHCMVMAGEWICRDEGNWDFVVDKTQMSRMVPFRDGITLRKLEPNVMKEFCYGEKVGSVALRWYLNGGDSWRLKQIKGGLWLHLDGGKMHRRYMSRNEKNRRSEIN